MALYGSSYSKFKGSDTVVISLNHSTVEKQWAKTNILRNKSVFTADTTFTKIVDDFAVFIVSLNIWKNGVPADIMNTILPYNHDTVNFMPHQDSGVYVQTAGSEVLTNGTFDTDIDWAHQAGWSIAGGLLVATAAGSGNTSINVGGDNAVATSTYKVTYTISGYSIGGVTARFGGALGTSRTANGTYTEILTAGSTAKFEFQANTTTTLNIDNASVVELTDASFYIESMTPFYFKNAPPILKDILVIKFVSLEAVDASGSIA
ncbi:MAG TPA: hypothetical protein ENH82_08680 [bacterium]|nr:hypothetical protein [bacterium]